MNDTIRQEAACALLQISIRLKSAIGMLSYARDEEQHESMLKAVIPSIAEQLIPIEKWIKSATDNQK